MATAFLAALTAQSCYFEDEDLKQYDEFFELRTKTLCDISYRCCTPDQLFDQTKEQCLSPGQAHQKLIDFDQLRNAGDKGVRV
jgi:hypothetical protein